MYGSILEAAERTCVAVIGDPGVGKSTFIQYMIAKLPKTNKKKIFWETECGHWRYYNGSGTIFGKEECDYWEADDVLVLIDGKFRTKHLSKKRNIVLFCSPQKDNYLKLIKKFSGLTYVMPSWDFVEIKQFLFSDIQVLVDLMDGFYNSMLNSLEEEEKLDPSTPRHDIDIDLEKIDELKLGSLDDFDEREAIQTMTKQCFLIHHVLYRYKLVGGRIRLLIHNDITFNSLKKQVVNSVNSLSLDEIKHQECLDLSKDVPSVVYSLKPVDVKSSTRDYDVLFASSYISERASIKLLREYGNQLNVLFAAMKDQRVGGSLIGQIFESIVLESIATKRLTKLEGKSLESIGASESSDFSIEFKSLILGDYDSISTDLSYVKNSTQNLFLTPNQLNAAAVDAMYFDGSLKKCYFLQMTISTEHGFKLKYLQDLAKALDINPTNIEMIFVVPEDCKDKFHRQKPLTMDGNQYRRATTGFLQRVVYVPGHIFCLPTAPAPVVAAAASTSQPQLSSE